MSPHPDLDALYAAAKAAEDALRAHGREDFILVLVVDDVATTQVCATDPDIRKGLAALINGEIVLEGQAAIKAELN
jgi:hypothetical protein